MANKPLSDSQLDALFSKGFISSDFYDTIKPADDKDKALKTEAKKAEEDYRLAENTMKMPALSKDQVADWTGASPKQPVVPPPPQQNVVLPASPTMEQVLAASNNRAPAPATQPLNLPTPQAAPDMPLPKTPLNLDQVVGAKPALPGQPSAEVITPTGPLKVQAPQGYPNPYAGPIDFEKFTTPAEKARKTQLVEESKLREDLTGRAVDLQTHEDKQVADSMAIKAKEYRGMIEGQAQIRAEENRIVQDNITKLNTQSEELSQKKIDPMRAFNSLPAGNKALAMLGMFIGAGGTRKGGQNPVVELINKHIDNDIKAQEFDIKNEGAGIDQRRGLLQDRVKQFGNLELGRIAAKKDYLDVYEMSLNALLADNTSEKTRLKGDEVLASLQEQRDKTLNDFNMANDQRARQLAAQAAAASAAANAKLYEDYKARRDSLLKTNEKRVEAGLAPLDMPQAAGNKSYDYQPSNPEFGKNAGATGVTLPFDPYTGKPLTQPQQFQARTKEDAEEIKKGNAAVQRIVRNIDQLSTFRKEENGGWVFDKAKTSKASALRADTLLAIKDAEKTGALDEGSVTVIGGMIPSDPSSYDWSIGPDAPNAQLAQTKDMVLNNQRDRLQNRLVPSSTNRLPKSPEQWGAVPNKK